MHVPDPAAPRERTAPKPPDPLAPDVRRALAVVVVARLGANAAVRVVYPFLPAIARGLGTSLERIADLTALSSIVGVLAPLAGRAAARFGARAVMLAALGMAIAGVAVIGLAPTVGVAAIGFVLIGMGKPGFDVPMQGWFGARVPYRRRGRVLGITELTWAGGLLAAVPLSGFLIARTSWRAQFVVVGVLLVIGLVVVAVGMPGGRGTAIARGPLVLTRTRVALLVVIGLFTVAAQGLFVVYGAWLEADIGLSVAGIGVFTLVVVAAELVGEGAVAAVGDRVGLRRSVIGALLLSTLAYLGLGFVGGSLVLAMAGVVAWFIAYEVTIVASIPLATEIGGEGRDRLLGLMVAVVAIARAGGSLIAPRVFDAGGIAASGLLAAGCTAAAAAVMLLLVPDPDGGPAVPGPDGADEPAPQPGP